MRVETMDRRKIAAPDLVAMKARGEKITMLTAYDYSMGRLVDDAGIDVALIGDSLGRVVLGYDTELKVTMEDMLRHTAAVARGVEKALVVADMPYLSYQVNDDEAVRNAGRLVKEAGAQAVKLEGAGRVAATIRRIVDIGIPVIGHVGLLPQSVHAYGGFKIQGRDPENAARIKGNALELQDAGVCAVVLEAIPAELASEITGSLAVPTIGIGAGPDCDGHVLVAHDMLGLYDKLKPSYVKQYADLWQVTLDAFRAYHEDVKSGRYPARSEEPAS